MRLLVVVTGVLVGYAVGYWIDASLACEVFEVWGNLCGFVGVFGTGPAGMVIGGLIACFSTLPVKR